MLARAPLMEDFKMASSRVGPRGGASLANGLMAGTCWARCSGLEWLQEAGKVPVLWMHAEQLGLCASLGAVFFRICSLGLPGPA